ncbi:MAG: RdgB/HAM1 family non-canonical purine NTP pyrophosphatase [Actinobacteria bacterium]|uniref:dITP/XTP pyrophosphatase n=1 Tax=freshwater metagenome TaxID=449393 RepID=A0A6J6LZR5_9ZZZZ|nr:RdgB/HAM1 family non-canonical purine NTP pyrophosphatase [Actinomycetota bacterium]MSZ59998.1 RdgB/HAM1 family non-canonical purine NTP pyrophosphatase [Actinomycetota bacterium]MSZ80562.1 RdgB/HAM1 family non-canonical purine NTP pyrophosphatase [Actinomycetota bacterium]MTB12082.1 RdgB/HAM1 family non-canonical purine NTP pyrophosphatase [Actinomycetota bacterium]
MRIVCASANPHKVEELARLLPSWVDLAPRPSDIGDIDEDAPTLEGNAIIKAVEIANHASEWAIADDTGLEVDALNGAPGVRSARFAGEDATDAENRALLLEKLSSTSNRSARFRTVVALVSSKGDIHFVSGECAGTIAESERGDGGFGYDSLFIPNDGDGRTFAEMTGTEKDAVSHRGRALAQLPELLARIFGLPTP